MCHWKSCSLYFITTRNSFYDFWYCVLLLTCFWFSWSGKSNRRPWGHTNIRSLLAVQLPSSNTHRQSAIVLGAFSGGGVLYTSFKWQQWRERFNAGAHMVLLCNVWMYQLSSFGFLTVSMIFWLSGSRNVYFDSSDLMTKKKSKHLSYPFECGCSREIQEEETNRRV